jgi:indoleamine 2,3-dioxygenase
MMFKTQINAAKAAVFQLTEGAVAKRLPAFTITRSRGFLPREVGRFYQSSYW